VTSPGARGAGPGVIDFVVVNADDFGASPEVNRAVSLAVDRGLATSATVMPTMPAFEEACSLARDRGFYDRLGVHVSLTAGRAITSAITTFRRLCEPDGSFVAKGPPGWRLTADERRAVGAEVRAQIEALRGQGIQPTHVDSHHHVHTRWAVLPSVLRAARESRVGVVRLSRNCGPGLTAPKRLYKGMINGRIRSAGLARTRRFGSAVDAAGVRPGEGPLEVMVHPSLDSTGQLVDGTRGAPAFVAPEIAWPSFRPMSYRELIALLDG